MNIHILPTQAKAVRPVTRWTCPPIQDDFPW